MCSVPEWREGKLKTGKEPGRPVRTLQLGCLSEVSQTEKFSRDRTSMGGGYLLCALQIKCKFPDR